MFHMHFGDEPQAILSNARDTLWEFSLRVLLVENITFVVIDGAKVKIQLTNCPSNIYMYSHMLFWGEHREML